MDIKNNIQIRSKTRVQDHGEVYTNEREVNAMLDLVKEESYRIDSRVLEPACGSGNFLIACLNRKMKSVERLYGKDQYKWELFGILAVSSLYGIDILADNIQEARELLLDRWIHLYKDKFNKQWKQDRIDVVKFIIETNLVCGNALTMKFCDNLANDTENDIIFAEWAILNGKLSRRDFTYSSINQCSTEGLDLFNDAGEDVWLPSPCKEYPLMTIEEVVDEANTQS